MDTPNSMTLDPHLSHRTLADCRLLRHQPRRQDRGPGRGRRTGRSQDANSAAAANACPMRAMARASKASPPPSRRCGRNSPPVSTAWPCRTAMPPGAARNALDCAFWDLEAKRSGRPVHELAGLACPATADHRLHDLARRARRDGRGRRQGRRPRAAQGQARRQRRRRSGAHRRGARRGAQGDADRRRQ